MSPTDNIRLPRNVRPRRYDLKFDFSAERETFCGSVAIDAEVVEATDRIVLHSTDLDISEATIAIGDGAPTVVGVEQLDADTIALETGRTIEPGPVRVSLVFTGEPNENLVGFYRAVYQRADGSESVMGCTQMEASHARRAFPCWDEPDFKAVFAISLTVDAGQMAVSNMSEIDRTAEPDGRVTVHFADTMVMSTYLVAWVIGELEATEPAMAGDIPVRVITPVGKLHLADTALRTAVFALQHFEDYYAITYPGDKLDLVAVPDFAFGAMENLGCVTFREVYLLVDEATVTEPALRRVCAVINHEIAHMWFGDLVTMSWWNGIWLNEAFATFMEVACLAAGHPEWDPWTDFCLSRSTAFTVDALASTRTIEFEVLTPDDAEGMFDVLTYEKGAGVLRMLEQYLGETVFRDGVRRYLKAHAYANTETHDLWDALEEVSGVGVREMMDRWIFDPGHPMVSAARVDGAVNVTIDRNTPVGAGSVEWTPRPVPLAARDLATETRHKEIASESATRPLASDAGISINDHGVGFYRVVLDDSLHEAFLAASDGLTSAERYQYLDDLWAGLLAGRVEPKRVVTTLAAWIDDTDPTVVTRICGLWGALGRISSDGEAYRQALREVVTSRTAMPVGTYEGEVGASWLILDGVLLQLDPAVQRARALVAAERGTTDRQLGGAAIDVVTANADSATFDDLVERWRAESDPQIVDRLLKAFGLAADPDIFERALALYRDDARSQDGAFVLRDAMRNQRFGSRAWEFVEDNWTTLTERFPRATLRRMAEGTRWLLDKGDADIEEFFTSVGFLPDDRSVEQDLELHRIHRLARERVGTDILEAIRQL